MPCPSQLFPVVAGTHLCTGAMLKSGNKESFPLLILNRPFTGHLFGHAGNLYQQVLMV